MRSLRDHGKDHGLAEGGRLSPVPGYTDRTALTLPAAGTALRAWFGREANDDQSRGEQAARARRVVTSFRGCCAPPAQACMAGPEALTRRPWWAASRASATTLASGARCFASCPGYGANVPEGRSCAQPGAHCDLTEAFVLAIARRHDPRQSIPTCVQTVVSASAVLSCRR
jgi:hypothetical protein